MIGLRRVLQVFLFIALAGSGPSMARAGGAASSREGGAAAAQAPSGASIPPVKTKALDDSEVVLPNPGSGGQVLVLVLGFSHKSAEEIEGWGKHLAADFHNTAGVAYYQMPDLQGVPGLVKPMILRGMRKDIAETEYPHFTPIYDHKKEWQSLVSYSAPDEAYVVVATPEGQALWQTHGEYGAESYAALKQAVAGQLAKSSPPVQKF